MSDKAIENKEALPVNPLIEDEESTEKHKRVDGHHLIERKQKTFFDGPPWFVSVHTRSIDEKSYKVTEIYTPPENACEGTECGPNWVTGSLERRVESDMTEDEVKKFEEDWTNLWNPDFTEFESESESEIEELHQ